MKLSLVLVSAFVFSMGEAHAAQVYSWADVVALTAQNNADLKSAGASLESSVDLKDASKSGFYPQVQASYQDNRNSVAGLPATTGSSASLSLTENVFNGLSDYATLQKNKATVKASEAAYQIAKA